MTLLARKRPSARRSDETKNEPKRSTNSTTSLKQRQAELKKSESKLADKERELEKRELDARTGFAAQNLAALSDLKKEIVD